jgi:hypothetical protein
MFATCQFDRRTKSASLRGTLVSPRVWALSLLVFLLVLALEGGSAAASEAPNPSAAPVESGPQLAITDFDGDLHPDLARVQAGATTSGGTDYWIQLQLSAAGWQSIRLVAPAGGLQIEARDVNGDHAVDLILSTPLNQPVAVFLNDGHGRFSRVAPSAFPEAFNGPLTNWASASGQETDVIGVPPQSRSSAWQAAKARAIVQSHADSIKPSREGFDLDSLLSSHADRGPPA